MGNNNYSADDDSPHGSPSNRFPRQERDRLPYENEEYHAELMSQPIRPRHLPKTFDDMDEADWDQLDPMRRKTFAYERVLTSDSETSSVREIPLEDDPEELKKKDKKKDDDEDDDKK